MQREIVGLKSRMDSIENVNRRVMVTLSQIVGDLTDIKRDMATKAELVALRGELNQRFDGFASLHHEMLFSRAVHKDRLDDYEKRLKKLEARRS